MKLALLFALTLLVSSASFAAVECENDAKQDGAQEICLDGRVGDTAPDGDNWLSYCRNHSLDGLKTATATLTQTTTGKGSYFLVTFEGKTKNEHCDVNHHDHDGNAGGCVCTPEAAAPEVAQ